MARRTVRVVARPRRDERGAVLVMSVAGLLLALVASALSVDIGRQVLERREDQAVADMVALDAVRDLADPQGAAEQAALRNGFDPSAPGSSLVAERGTLDAANNFTPDPAGRAVRVTVGSTMDYVFAPGSASLSARAVARMSDRTAMFGIGSTLATVNASYAPVINPVLGAMIGGNADVVGWQGLATSYVTVAGLQQQLANAGFQVGTVDQLLDAEITLADLAQATADALSASGDSNAALYSGAGGIVAQSTSTTKFRLGDFVEAGQGTGSGVLSAKLNAWRLLTASAIVANGTNLVSVPSASVTVPGVSNTALTLKVIEGPKWKAGPVGTTVDTAQVELSLTTTLNLPITVTGLVGARVTGSLPLDLTAAGATGTLHAIDCPDPNGGITVRVATQAVSGSGSSTLRVSSVLPLVGLTGLLDVATAAAVGTTPNVSDVPFDYPSEFDPPAGSKQAGPAPVGLGGMTSLSQAASAVPLAAVPVPVPTVVDATFAAVKGVLDTVDSSYLTPLLDALGVRLGVADVWADQPYFAAQSGCDRPQYPVLVG